MTSQAVFWNKIADSYSKDPVKNVDAFEKKIAFTKSKITPQSTVLGVGCGTGSLALRLAETKAQVHGIDISSEMIRIARGKAEKQGVENVTFYEGAFDDSFVEVQNGTVDVICAYSILHLLPDRGASLRRMHRLLKPGGWLVTSTAVLADSWVPFAPLVSLMTLLGKAPKGVGVFGKEQLRTEIASAGFTEATEPEVGTDKITAFVVARKSD